MSTIERPIGRLFADPASAIGQKAIIKGWVRTRRDSKAGLSFVHVSDGSCFDPIQVVVPN